MTSNAIAANAMVFCRVTKVSMSNDNVRPPTSGKWPGAIVPSRPSPWRSPSAAGRSADGDERRHVCDSRVDGAEHVVDVRTKLLDADDTDDGDQADEEAVLDHRRA